MLRRHTIITINLLISGFIAFVVTIFLAGGGISENYTDKTFVAPQYFIILVIWGIGAILGFIVPFKDSENLLYSSLGLMWGSFPASFILLRLVT